jgi:hypothetical protein
MSTHIGKAVRVEDRDRVHISNSEQISNVLVAILEPEQMTIRRQHKPTSKQALPVQNLEGGEHSGHSSQPFSSMDEATIGDGLLGSGIACMPE